MHNTNVKWSFKNELGKKEKKKRKRDSRRRLYFAIVSRHANEGLHTTVVVLPTIHLMCLDFEVSSFPLTSLVVKWEDPSVATS